jgi:predicted nuclease with RNAse H fold
MLLANPSCRKSEGDSNVWNCVLVNFPAGGSYDELAKYKVTMGAWSCWDAELVKRAAPVFPGHVEGCVKLSDNGRLSRRILA